jgi:hypothetical protein
MKGTGLIMDLFKKKGIESVDQLSTEEKADYDRWTAILSAGDVTVDSLLKFCQNQINLIQIAWRDKTNSKEMNDRLVMQFNVYSTLVQAITSPTAEREALEKYLTSMIGE